MKIKLNINHVLPKRNFKTKNNLSSKQDKTDSLSVLKMNQTEEQSVLKAKEENKVTRGRTGKHVFRDSLYEPSNGMQEEEDSQQEKKSYTRKGANSEVRNSKATVMARNLFTNNNKLAKGYYVLLFAMIGLGTASVVLTAKAYHMFKQENYSVYGNADSGGEVAVSSSIQTTDPSSQTQEAENVTNNQDTRKKEANKESTAQTVTAKKQETPKVVPLAFVKPLQGETLKVYAADKVLYSKTLELWKTHDGIDIKADLGQSVKSIEKGVVEKVYEDSFYGMTIVIDHGQGYKSSYSNLDKEVSVSVKQSITKGKVIGKIGSTAIGEIKDDPHLHFMLFKDNKNVDPSSIFK